MHWNFNINIHEFKNHWTGIFFIQYLFFSPNMYTALILNDNIYIYTHTYTSVYTIILKSLGPILGHCSCAHERERREVAWCLDVRAIHPHNGKVTLVDKTNSGAGWSITPVLGLVAKQVGREEILCKSCRETGEWHYWLSWRAATLLPPPPQQVEERCKQSKNNNGMRICFVHVECEEPTTFWLLVMNSTVQSETGVK